MVLTSAGLVASDGADGGKAMAMAMAMAMNTFPRVPADREDVVLATAPAGRAGCVNHGACEADLWRVWLTSKTERPIRGPWKPLIRAAVRCATPHGVADFNGKGRCREGAHPARHLLARAGGARAFRLAG